MKSREELVEGTISAILYRPEQELEDDIVCEMSALHSVGAAKDELGRSLIKPTDRVRWRAHGRYASVGDEVMAISISGGAVNWQVAAMDMFRDLDKTMALSDEAIKSVINAMETFNGPEGAAQ